jgi:EmrB/QacA subfamily drug resistance transporter
MSRNRIIVVTIGIMMGLFLASIEGTVVGTAMPTIVSELKGLEIYSWVFSIYMLTQTCLTPVYGKLSDIYGRRPIYMIAVVLFLLGSMLSGTANSMVELVIYRGLQGIGAGGLLPLAFTIIGDIFTLQQRAKMQGLFSGVWGVSSLVGPLAGGFIVENSSWRWVFYINLPFGLLAAALIWFGLQEDKAHRAHPTIDFAGVFLLVSGVVSFLLVLLQGPKRAADAPILNGWTSPLVIGLGVASVMLLALFIWNEQRVREPIIPPSLFHQKLFSIGSLHGFLSGMAMFGSISFIPLFAQGVLGSNATVAGATLTPALLGWTLSSIIGGRLLLTFGYRKIVITSAAIMCVGAFLMSQIGINTTTGQLLVASTLLGLGMGGGVSAFLISIQTNVTRQQLGAATSTLQFTRSIGGTVGVSIFGTIMSTKLLQGLAQNPSLANFDPSSLLDRLHPVAPELLAQVRGSLADGIASVFALAFIAVLLSLVIVLFSPKPEPHPAPTEREPRSEPVIEAGGD